MVRKEIQRLLRRGFVLAALLTSLTLASSGGVVENSAGAAICCDQCFENYYNCFDNCAGNPTCEQACHNTLVSCYRFCNPDC